MVAKVRKKKAKTSKAKTSTATKKATKAKKPAAKTKTAKAKAKTTKAKVKKSIAKTTKAKATTTKAKTAVAKKATSAKVTPVKTPAREKAPVQTRASQATATVLHGLFKPYQPTKTEEYMNDKQLTHFKAILDTWRKELMEEVDHTISELKEASVLADPNDRATQEETFSLELRTRDRERKLIKKIENALEQIEEKEYGYCEACGVEIGIRRLEARPTANLCIDCKTLDEIKEKRS